MSRITYILRLYRALWKSRGQYDVVFVHMNQEYVLLAGWLWLLMGKKVYLWRNHHAGNALTTIAASFCTNVFCTSRFSYTARYPKTRIMPVGIDTDVFTAPAHTARVPRSVLFLSRIAPSKKVEVFIEALRILHARGISFTASVYGEAIPEHRAYAGMLRADVATAGLADCVQFYPGISNERTPEVYAVHAVSVNTSSSGMYDKTIFEAMACGALTVSGNKNLIDNIDSRQLMATVSPEALAERLAEVLEIPDDVRAEIVAHNRVYTENVHSLTALVSALQKSIGAETHRFARYSKAARYVISGGVAATLDLALLYFFTTVCDIWYLASALLAFLIAVGVSFMLQKFWTFADATTHRLRSQMSLFFVVMCVNLGLNTLLMFLFVEYGGVPYLGAQVLAGGLIACESFFIYQRVFGMRV